MTDHGTAATALRCKECERTGELTAAYVCEYCFGPLEVVYDMERIAARVTRESIAAGPPSLWRYRDFLPCSPDDPTAGLPSGMTPLVRAPRLAAALGLRDVWVKNDTANPTHSFKDRVVSVALEKAKQLGFEVVACASTGNLANSVAAHASAHGLESYVFVPADLEEQKIVATAIYGTTLLAVDGNYDDVNRLCMEIASDRPWAFVNVNVRPYYSEGSKTLAYEVAEQLGWRLPDRCIVPIASGSLYTKVNRGFRDLIETGLVEDTGRLPVMNGAQSAGCGPVATAWEKDLDFVSPVRPDTIAKSLAIGNPADGVFALDVARRTGGSISSVTEEEILQGIELLARTTGIFTETAGGVTTAVLAKLAAAGEIDPDERVVVYITGDGLKTLDAVASRVVRHPIAPTVASFEAAIGEPARLIA
ncbi:threonine synthase [Miltoncostaea oceani]|uniref:threonine synthase n=1 Tax=Miltoncostaea oceani TaxID=2843216 RepID=UPI001C3D6DEA|nr:threonine synthase [Miltoncostaea oceani]